MGLALLIKIASLFLILLAGYIVVRCGLLSSDSSRVLSVIMLYIIIPSSIIYAFQINCGDDIRSSLLLSFIAGGVAQLAMVLLIALFRKPLKLCPVEQASIIFPNSGNLLIPLVSSVLGEEWIVFTCGFSCMQIALVWTYGKILLSGEKQFDIKKILLNVNIISIAIGFLIFILGIRLPSFMHDAINGLGSFVGPGAMLIIGMLMAGMDLKKAFCQNRIWLIVFIKLLVMPLLFILLVCATGLNSCFHNGETVLLITMMAVGAPSAAMISQMAQIYGGDAEYACSINVVTTLLCIISLPLMVTIYQMF